MKLFDLQTYDLHQQRARPSFEDHAFLYHHVAKELTSRLDNFDRSFEKVLSLAPHPLSSFTNSSVSHCVEGRGPHKAIQRSPQSLRSFAMTKDDMLDSTYNLIFSCLEAQWIEDLPRYLKSIYQALTKKGLFLGALPGGQTLVELRESLLKAEIALTGGATPRVAPMLQPSDAPQLLGRAGFSSPIVDTETLTVTYPSMKALMKDLRGMGETNSLCDRTKTFTQRNLFEKAETIYRSTFSQADGTLRATFEIIYLTGWKV